MNTDMTVERVRDLLSNWRNWARDCPPDPAEVHYYTVSPDFVDYVKPNPGPPPYDSDSAEMVEEVLREMYGPYRAEYRLIKWHYGQSIPQVEIARAMRISRRAIHYRLQIALRVFSEHWVAHSKKL